MGTEIQKTAFDRQDYQAFQQELVRETQDLQCTYERGEFVTLQPSVGYELEACLVDARFYPADANKEFLRRLNMPQVVAELARFNIEFNGSPQDIRGDGLSKMRAEMEQWLERAREVAQGIGLNVIMIGVLPTIRKSHLDLSHISQSNRYLAIDRSLERVRGTRKVRIDIRGKDHYHGEYDSIMAESAATSLQLHLSLPVDQTAAWYNAALAASGAVLAVAANSPFWFGHNLWAETRIPIFAQSVDTGAVHYVSFGRSYLRDSVLELFEENLSQYPVLLPVKGDASRWPHLQMHNGTIWRWNRPILGTQSEQGLHFRLEHRSLPSGPSVPDMVANCALFYGLVRTLSCYCDIDDLLPFGRARDNFYEAARNGIAARLWWNATRYPADQLMIQQLLPMAVQGMRDLGISESCISLYATIITDRVNRGLSGAGWQRAWVATHGGDMHAMLSAYGKHQRSGLPVSEWPI